MNVKELIEKLQELDPELEVLEYNRDYGFDPVEVVVVKEAPDHRPKYFYPQVGRTYVVING